MSSTPLSPRRLLLLLVAALCLALAAIAQQEQRRVVYVAAIDGVIDLGLAPYVQRVLDQAQADGAAAVVLEINTFGGRVDAAVQIRDAVLGSPMRTVAFINRRAISAGALISLAATDIVMAGGGTIGAATPVQMGQQGQGAKPVEEKSVSYVRKEFRATAESRQRPPLLAEAMVDADVVIEGVTEKGKLLTLTTDEAIAQKLVTVRADKLEDALEKLGLGGAEIRRTAPNWAENIVRWLTHPVVSSLLVTVAMVGILVELRTPGFGFPGAIGVGSLGLFLWGHWLAQLAGWEELLLAGLGVILLALEVLVIPGFGVAGLLGILALLSALVLSTFGPGATPEFVVAAASRLVFALIFAIVISLLLLRMVTRLPVGRRLVLETELPHGQGYASPLESEARWLGKQGVTSSPLRPAGIAVIEGQRVDVVSEGELIDPGEPVQVLRVDGNRIVVTRINNTALKEQT